MCKYCEEDAFNVLIKSEQISNMIYWIVGKSNEVKREDIDEVDNDAFIRWSQIMMNEAHWGPEFLNLQKAWEGAIGFQESMGTLQIHEDLMRFDDFNAYLKHIGLDVFKE